MDAIQFEAALGRHARRERRRQSLWAVFWIIALPFLAIAVAAAIGMYRLRAEAADQQPVSNRYVPSANTPR